jgi:4,5-DOPA dioxygenase extradiol
MSSSSSIMPAIFFGHGSPMIALETNSTTEVWRRIGASMPRPKAILCVSAHWYTRGTAVTAMAAPKTIHDFGAFPRALFEMQYPAPGSLELAKRVQALLAPTSVTLDETWGLDHGTWSVLVKAFPKADIPVVQLSMDATQPPGRHFEMGQKLSALRAEGVLIMGTGNVVHNLSMMSRSTDAPPYDWAVQFHDYVRSAVADNIPSRLVNYASIGKSAELSVPSPDHYWPLLYIAGARRPDDVAHFDVDHVENSSLSMLTVRFEPEAQA